MHAAASTQTSQLQIGWGQADITPDKTVTLDGQFHVRVSEGVKDPISVTAMALDNGSDHVMFLVFDLVGQSDAMLANMKAHAAKLKGLNPDKIIISVTHTHTAPTARGRDAGGTMASIGFGIDLGVDLMTAEDYIQFATDRAAQAMKEAWENRKPGKIAYGLTHSVIGRNRRWTALDGTGIMYGDTTKPTFSHIEGYEDHTINIIAAYDMNDALTGLVINTACPSQDTEGLYEISADFWHETRQTLRKRHGEKLYILPQCSSAGDQSPHPIWAKNAEARMLELKGISNRQEIANRLAAAVDDVLPAIAPTATGDLQLRHIRRDVSLPMNALTQKDVDDALAGAAAARAEYEKLKAEIEKDPSIRQKPRWYVDVTRMFRRAGWLQTVVTRFEQLKTQPTYPATLHALRLGDMVLTTQPFEYYVDFGLRIKARSPAAQTFLLQLVGKGTYCPSRRSVAGGGYGSVPASNIVGPEAGEKIVDESLEMIDELWNTGS